jgi:hypothetical protein
MKILLTLVTSGIIFLTSCSEQSITNLPLKNEITLNKVKLNVEYSSIHSLLLANYKDSVVIFFYYNDSLQVNIASPSNVWNSKKIIPKIHIGKPPYNMAMGGNGYNLGLLEYTFPK